MRPLLCCCLLVLVAFDGFGDSVPLTSVADTTISEGNAAHANGMGPDFIVGGLLQFTSRCRGLMRFDLSSVPSAAVITSATVTVAVTISKAGASEHNHGLHRLLAPWDERSATWDGSGVGPWDGGDFIVDADASLALAGAETYTFESTTGLVATVQMWLTNSEMNHGWILISQDETAPATARRIAARESGSSGPTLTIGYSMPLPPEPLVRILSMDLSSSNVVLKSTGNWLAVPEFSSNLVVSNWAVVPDFTNSFLDGTNVTIFSRLDPIYGSNVFLRVRNARN